MVAELQYLHDQLWGDELTPDVLVVGRGMVLGPEVGIVELARAPVDAELFLAFMIAQPINMSIVFVHLGWIFPVTNPSAIQLSVWSGVAGCLCPSSSRMMQMKTASQAMMYSAASLASVADAMMCLMMWAIFIMAPLLGGISALEERKKCPPVRLHAPGF